MSTVTEWPSGNNVYLLLRIPNSYIQRRLSTPNTRESFLRPRRRAATPHSIAVAELEPFLFVFLLCRYSFVLTYINRHGSLFQQGCVGSGEVPVALEKLTSWKTKCLR